MGALELYRRDPGRLTESQHDSASACATAIAARLQANWESCVVLAGSAELALEAVTTFDALSQSPDAFTRTQVHIAAGMVAEQLGISAAQGVDRLRAHSYADGRALSSLAADIIARLTRTDSMADQAAVSPDRSSRSRTSSRVISPTTWPSRVTVQRWLRRSRINPSAS